MFGSRSVSMMMSLSQIISCILVLCSITWLPSTLGRPRSKEGLESQAEDPIFTGLHGLMNKKLFYVVVYLVQRIEPRAIKEILKGLEKVIVRGGNVRTAEEPECEPRSVCGYIQLNDNGPNVQTLCRCRYGVFCPLEWDIYDGHTILHGNDQYKFCERVLPLPRCTITEPAYTSYLEMSFLSEATLVNTARLHCICPGDHLLLRNDSQFRQYDDGIASISTTYLCLPAPLCETDSTCSAVTSNFRDKTSFMTRHCACPDGSFCPSHPALAKDRVDLDKGSYYIMGCVQMI